MTEKIESPDTETLSPIEQIRAVLAEKHARIGLLEASLPTLGSGLLAEAVLFYLVAANAEYFAMCQALANAASSVQSAPNSDTEQADAVEQPDEVQA